MSEENDIVVFKCYECGEEYNEKDCYYREEFYHILCDDCYCQWIDETGGREDDEE